MITDVIKPKPQEQHADSSERLRFSLFVTTYHKYNTGEGGGQWLDLNSFQQKADFIAACKKIHADEQQPELMFLDFDFPIAMNNLPLVHECYVSKVMWESGLMECNQKTLDIIQDYLECTGRPTEFDASFMGQALEALYGVFDSVEDFAKSYLLELKLTLSNEEFKAIESLIPFIDYERYAKDLLKKDFSMASTGRVFRL